MKKFEQLEELREESGLSQTEFMPYMGFTQQSAYSRLENGTHAPTHQQKAHVAALQVIIDHGLLEELEENIEFFDTKYKWD